MTQRRLVILHLVHRMSTGGAERVLVNLINGSCGRFKHIVCSFYRPTSFINEILPEKRHVVCLEKNEGNDITIPFKIASLCRQFDVNVIHAQGWSTYVEGLFAAKITTPGTRFVFAFRGKTLEDTKGIPKRRIVAQKMLYHLVDAVLTPSHEMCKDYSETIGIDPRKISVIYNGIDLNRANLPRQMRMSRRKEFGFGPYDVVIGCVARFDPVKNIPDLIKAFAGLKELKNNTRLLIVGDGPEMCRIRSLVKSLDIEDRIVMPGMRRDIYDCYSAMDIYVQPSIYEGVSNTVLEAMGAGLPVIATNVGGTPEIVDNGVTGLLVDAQDVEMLKDNIDKILKDRSFREQLGQAALKMAKERFSVESMCLHYDNLFDALC